MKLNTENELFGAKGSFHKVNNEICITTDSVLYQSPWKLIIAGGAKDSKPLSILKIAPTNRFSISYLSRGLNIATNNTLDRK